jgi:hypothetical protein
MSLDLFCKLRHLPASVLGCGALMMLSACGGSGGDGTSTVMDDTEHEFAVSVQVLGEGGVTPSSIQVLEGDSQTFTLVPEAGHELASVTGCDGTLSDDHYQTSAITAPCTVTVAFSIARANVVNDWSHTTQSSNRAAQWGFDFVEEFDGLQDWNQSHLGRVGNQWDSTHPERMPLLEDGSPSPWGYFSAWDRGGSSTHNWIGGTDEGRQVWRGTKSASIDLGGAKGPSRLGLFMGEGYHHWSLFYMVYIPRNAFPTHITCTNGTEEDCVTRVGGLGSYHEGDPYTYWAAWKFNTFSIGCDSSRCTAVNETYGPHTMVPLIKQYNYDPFGATFALSNGTNHETVYTKQGGTVLDDLLGDWFGVEMEVENISGTQFRMNVWVYDRDGNARHMGQDIINDIVEVEAHGQTWDHFFFGGNNSGSWEWGPTMVSHYYIDDFILDEGSKGQIGPRYFQAIGVLP